MSIIVSNDAIKGDATFSCSKQCHGCQKRFTTLTRRHHCRMCAHSYCQACSSHHAQALGVKHRVCEACHTEAKNNEKPVPTLCMATSSAACDFKPVALQRRPLGDYDVLIHMKYCGVCHSDLSVAAGHMDGVNPAAYPCVPGHELAGVCEAVGPKVSLIQVGQQVGVGCMVDSCQRCSSCRQGEEQKCTKQVGTYCGKDNGSGRAATYPAGQQTLGGYTTKMVVDENFAIRIPDGYPLEMAGPVMCAGITMYDPLKRLGMKPGDRVGIVGLGGLGQMGIKIAKVMGCSVTVISRSRSKAAFAAECGADAFVDSGAPEEMQAHINTLDLILNTVPVYHDYVAYHPLLKKAGKQVLLGLHAGVGGAFVVNAMTFGHSRVMMSAIGGVKNTQEVMNLCAEHKIYPHIKIVPAHELNEVYSKLEGSNDAGLRYVLDIENTLNEATAEKCVAPPPTFGEFKGGLTVPDIAKEGLWLFFTGKWW